MINITAEGPFGAMWWQQRLAQRKQPVAVILAAPTMRHVLHAGCLVTSSPVLATVRCSPEP